METKLVLIDTSVFIEYFRKSKKENSLLFKLRKENFKFSVSTITYFEIESGKSPSQVEFWQRIYAETEIIPFASKEAETASKIFQTLKRKNKMIDSKDLFIAATAIAHSLPVATINKKHFERIESLEIISEL